MVISNNKQEAQLWQRDRATTAWVSFGQNITGRWYSSPNVTVVTYRSIFNHCDVIGLLIYWIRWNNAKLGLLRRSGSFKVTDVGPIESPYEFLLVINTN